MVAVFVVVVGGVLIGVSLSRGSGNQEINTQLSTLQQACSQWSSTGSGPSTPPSGWCTNMTGWMSGRMDDHPGMWATPDAMRTTCQSWAASSASVGVGETEGSALCRDMVDWMQQHAAQWGSWNGWMMHGPMMG